MRLLDIFCCAGGAAMGYSRAGFDDIEGWDIDHQPRYPFRFRRGDWRELTVDYIRTFDGVHASPPCQRYSDLARRNNNVESHPDFVAPVRELLLAAGVPYIMENVPEAPLLNPVQLCGTMFPPLRVLRHRGFESSFPLVAPPHPKHPLVFTHDKRKAHYGKLDQDVSFVQVTGGGNCSMANAKDAMGIDWMSKQELNEAIPPAYTEYLGRQFLDHIRSNR